MTVDAWDAASHLDALTLSWHFLHLFLVLGVEPESPRRLVVPKFTATCLSDVTLFDPSSHLTIENRKAPSALGLSTTPQAGTMCSMVSHTRGHESKCGCPGPSDDAAISPPVLVRRLHSWSGFT
ncbi:hypothetical protein CONLIGDRAFT_665357 [Coniochaeta ligniaria NRRL 30616]|uniref:Uncharacterized protein n=1 Tax=Coniochaeta ligniaria NRRL 30616 TaxID=1408157 RepID=A0A1J7J4C1_9PEZI|nr:hypothetical protein CONLIGDRAFT_665357 [Coniochaeta ligniaria NRRL 30616]